MGYTILENFDTGQKYLGAFTLLNALIHFGVAVFLNKRELADRNLFYLIAGLVLIFITIAVPVQLDGNWVSILWAAEAALLFWLGRAKGIRIYEYLSYPVIALAFGSLMIDWQDSYNSYNYRNNIENALTPIFNKTFLTSLICIVAFGFINWLNLNKNYNSPFEERKGILRLIAYAIPLLLLFVIYKTFELEISNYWNQLYYASKLEVGISPKYNIDLHHFRNIWTINYSMLFVTILSFVNIKRIKNKQLSFLNLGLNGLAILFFLTSGLYILSQLSNSYINQSLAEYYDIGISNIVIRYISFGFLGALLWTTYQYIKQDWVTKWMRMFFEVVLHISILAVLSFELIHWMDFAGSTKSYKIGLSILWGVYALALIAYGIWKQKQHLRIGGMGLFALTLAKLFLYDIAHLNTISKTIVLVSLGILLLIISFLYNKYNQKISDEKTA